VRLAAGASAPNIQMIPLSDKKPEQLANYAGRIVVLEFWATWCGPCQKFMADLQGYPGKYPDWKDKVVLIAASVDDEPDAAAERLEAKGWNKTRNVWVESDAIKAFHVNGLPAIYVIDQQGKVAAGDADEDIPTVVNRLLKGK
jgi:thiol-disulfide isomerase/thioredoxin